MAFKFFILFYIKQARHLILLTLQVQKETAFKGQRAGQLHHPPAHLVLFLVHILFLVTSSEEAASIKLKCQVDREQLVWHNNGAGQQANITSWSCDFVHAQTRILPFPPQEQKILFLPDLKNKKIVQRTRNQPLWQFLHSIYIQNTCALL